MDVKSTEGYEMWLDPNRIESISATKEPGNYSVHMASGESIRVVTPWHTIGQFVQALMSKRKHF